MKSTLVRWLIITLILAVIVAGLLLYIGGDNYLLMTFGDRDAIAPAGGYKMSMQLLALVAIGMVLATIIVWSFLHLIYDLPSRLRSGVSKRKRGQALEAMEDALIAASAGDADMARKKAARARTLIDRPALGNIVAAQAAEISGDPAEAQQRYALMLDDERTRKVAQRGLAGLAYARGDLHTARSHAEQAYSENKGAKWALDILFSAQVAESDWGNALKTLEDAVSRKHISKDIAARRATVLHSAIADQMAGDGQFEPAREKAERVAVEDPGFAPGVALAAQLLVRAGDNDRAAKLIESSWSRAPHPALSLAYRDLFTTEPQKVRAKRMKALAKQNPSHRESQIVTAEEALRSGDGVAALSALDGLLKSGAPSARLCELAAKAETLLNNPNDARLWISRAATAPTDPDWSDLDPSGAAFEYNDADWRRLVFSYGDEGKLIHPRFERLEAARPAMEGEAVIAKPVVSREPAPTPKVKAVKSKGIKLEDVLKPPSPDDPGVE
ncbi:heme biosynthesis protein HemY [Robiginitomaculum antarcticum]|uniref:heme biosynthesis protein HemY n=1 Tax=Robiginitomaculum antarcticum TaxID=437507 RepID=UPI000360B937|nr:heme biosynthesis HemY N-terminal domain-containing protein [Robiginitomaculum antarcticum]